MFCDSTYREEIEKTGLHNIELQQNRIFQEILKTTERASSGTVPADSNPREDYMRFLQVIYLSCCHS